MANVQQTIKSTGEYRTDVTDATPAQSPPLMAFLQGRSTEDPGSTLAVPEGDANGAWRGTYHITSTGQMPPESQQ